jgi:hypothetical protein
MLKAIALMVVAADKNQDDQDDVRCKEQLVGPDANQEHAKWRDHDQCRGGNDSSDPKLFRAVCGVSSSIKIVNELQDKVSDSLKDGKIPYPAMMKKEDEVTPVGDMKQDIVSSGEERKYHQVNEAQDTGTSRYGRDEGFIPTCENVVRLHQAIRSHHENEVDEAQTRDEHGLTPSGHQSGMSW